ncbi:unnamed protein product [Zymoseptoria tritici ST99CH_1A5]|uniref:2EXR domain-containing protein n=1 Tax=Zymoseptoria tritici ST99CH_1A5 TaxID=1276529 RepID=A0A1Y6LX11_ZYMTR|nr:unnamed protein product [Zymoseptoria tritici ST99CH_1A5]
MENENCHFGKLSPELRNEVYSYLLPHNQTIPVLPISATHYGTVKHFEEVQPPITKVCRQIRNETKPMLYGTNKFVLPLPTHEGDGHHEHHVLKQSISRAEIWLKCNPLVKSPLRAQLVITVELRERYWNRISRWDQCDWAWESLADALKTHGYTEKDYVIEAYVYGGIWRPLALRRPPSVSVHFVGRRHEIEEGFRECGLRCETI